MGGARRASALGNGQARLRRVQGHRGKRHEALQDADAADDVDRGDGHGVSAGGAHSDQERILEAELYRFVRFHYDIVADLARAK